MKTSKWILAFILFMIAGFTLKTTSFKHDKTPTTHLEISGFPGEIINKCIDKRILGQDVDHLIQPFTLKNETWCWQSEFWGKWMLSAVSAYTYNQDPRLMKKMEHAVDGLIATQLENGYIGNYGPDTQLTAWDIWGRKYSMLGLIKYYEISNDKKALKAAAKVADHLIDQIGPNKVNIVKTGFYRGMASSSILEPMFYLYNHTSNKKYLEFCNYIVTQWETEDGPQLISKALENIHVADRFPPPEKWWSWENGQKAYEMMSCYDGLLELYKVTGKPDYLEAVIKTAQDILETEINIAGSGSAFECWYGTIDHQTRPTYHTMETCVTTTWMKLCHKLLDITGDPKYADHIERSFYNALMASMKYDASEIAKYSPLEGMRHAGEEQCSMHINCCNANGPRGFAMMPAYGIKTKENNIFINYYGASTATVLLEKNKTIKIYQKTTYPKSGKIQMLIEPSTGTELSMNLRIPLWSSLTKVDVNGNLLEDILPGTYVTIARKWKKGDVISIELDMRGKLRQNHAHQAITRGPIVLARDSRFDDGFVDEGTEIQNENGIVKLTEIQEKPAHIWMAFSALCKTGTDLEGTGKVAHPVYFCDFASAGNTWDPTTRYKVWLPNTLNTMHQNYEGY